MPNTEHEHEHEHGLRRESETGRDAVDSENTGVCTTQEHKISGACGDLRSAPLGAVSACNDLSPSGLGGFMPVRDADSALLQGLSS